METWALKRVQGDEEGEEREEGATAQDRFVSAMDASPKIPFSYMPLHG
jgi:hypothetical protein